VKEIIQVFVFLFGAIIFAAIFVSSWADTIYAWKILEYEGEGALRVPVYPIRSLILLGSALTTIYFLAHLTRSVVAVLKECRGRS
jgi:TRAP-type mannitol/chloroaromatic compound transport system permease small subunit